MQTKLILFFGVLGCFSLKAVAAPASFPMYQVIVESETPSGNSFVLNKHQTLLVTFKPLVEKALPITDFKFDARMPQHKHGMVTQAQVEKIEEFKYRLKGVRLHMPGEWVLEFLIKNETGQTRMEVPWNLPSS